MRDLKMSTVLLMASSGHDRRRDENAADLVKQLDAHGFVVEVCDDPTRNGVLWNYLQILEHARLVFETTDDDWVLTLQDDAYLREGWDEQLAPALINAPKPVVYLDHNAGTGWTYRNYAYLEVRRGGWGRMVAYRREVIEQISMVAATLAKDPLYKRWDDVIPVLTGLIYGWTTCMTTQSFAGSIDVKSLIGHPKQKPAQYTLETPIIAPRWDIENTRFTSGSANPDIRLTADWVKKELGL